MTEATDKPHVIWVTEPVYNIATDETTAVRIWSDGTRETIRHTRGTAP